MEDNIFKNLPIVTISGEGKFKYIVIHAVVEEQKKKTQLDFIRGDAKLEYHAQNFVNFANEIKSKGFQIKLFSQQKGKISANIGKIKVLFTCPGGGRIQHNHNGNKCSIYGYSKSYGKVNHTLAQNLISKHLCYALNQIKTSQTGY